MKEQNNKKQKQTNTTNINSHLNIKKRGILRVQGTAVRGSRNRIKPQSCVNAEIWRGYIMSLTSMTNSMCHWWGEEKIRCFRVDSMLLREKEFFFYQKHTRTKKTRCQNWIKKASGLLRLCDRGAVRTLSVNWSNCSLGGTPSSRDKLPSASHAAAQGPRKKKARKRAKMEGFLF